VERRSNQHSDLFRVLGSLRPAAAGVCERGFRFGWELKLVVNDGQLSVQVCRSQDAVLETGDAWKAAMVEKGWA
jgi:hypothetical protein